MIKAVLPTLLLGVLPFLAGGAEVFRSDFESGLNQWENPESAATAALTTVAASGKQALEARFDPYNPTGKKGNNAVRSIRIPVKKGGLPPHRQGPARRELRFDPRHRILQRQKPEGRHQPRLLRQQAGLHRSVERCHRNRLRLLRRHQLRSDQALDARSPLGAAGSAARRRPAGIGRLQSAASAVAGTVQDPAE